MTPPQLTVRSSRIADPGELTAWLPNSGPRQVWLRDGDGLVGWGEAIRVEFDSIDDAANWWDHCRELLVDQPVFDADGVRVPGSGAVVFGSFTFDPAGSTRRSVMIVPRHVIGRRGAISWRTEISAPTDAARTDAARTDTAHTDTAHTNSAHTNSAHTDSAPTSSGPTDSAPDPADPLSNPPNNPPLSPAEVAWSDGPLNPPLWRQAVAGVIERLRAGALDKVVLSRAVVATSPEPIDWRWPVQQLARQYRRCWTFWVDDLVGATPEMLLRLDRGLATSRVLAGTIGRGLGDAPALTAALASSAKDLAEHRYSVGSVARALAPSCTAMHVPDAPYVLELPNVLHLASDVTAVARPGIGSLHLAAALHPSAAVCGSPTDTARRVIAEVEALDRGRYSGPVGWSDADGDGEWGIALRCGEIVDDCTIRLFAGCGIVADSDPDSELIESTAKLIPMRDALGH